MNRRSEADHYTLRAKKEGYPARSVYKLEEIDRKQPIVAKGARVLDVGAAPGSWSLWLSRRVGSAGVVVAVDLSELSLRDRPSNLIEVTGDIYEEPTQAMIMEHAPFDAVVSDAAPATTGSRTVDTSRSAALVEFLLYMLPSWLRSGGSFAAKLFQGGDEQRLLSAVRETFGKAKTIKPKACRKDSFETYLIGVDYDPKL